MAKTSSIEWTETTWNPVVGCTKVSSGCSNCYAERMGKRLASMSKARTRKGQDPGRTALYEKAINLRGRWSGELSLSEPALQDPYLWKSSRKVFVNSMSDLFHEKVPKGFIKRVFQVMNECSQHSFQVLTKRPERVAEMAHALKWSKNVWMGTSVENAEVMDRVAWLTRVDACIRFLSIEPLLGPLPEIPLDGIDWVIVGGESGPGARPILEEWVTDIRDQCLNSAVPFFFKQWGGFNKKRNGRHLEGETWDQLPQLKERLYA